MFICAFDDIFRQKSVTKPKVIKMWVDLSSVGERYNSGAGTRRSESEISTKTVFQRVTQNCLLSHVLLRHGMSDFLVNCQFLMSFLGQHPKLSQVCTNRYLFRVERFEFETRQISRWGAILPLGNIIEEKVLSLFTISNIVSVSKSCCWCLTCVECLIIYVNRNLHKKLCYLNSRGGGRDEGSRINTRRRARISRE